MVSIYFLLTTLAGVLAQSILGFAAVGQPYEFYGTSLTAIVVTAQVLCCIPFFLAGKSYTKFMTEQDILIASDLSKSLSNTKSK